ncbi:hypothetical protein TWF730_001547 [Orbilia blumenaviensis]|uniref:Uncharacterized protein n=1 Tax=Orbilia blumenaviensis TaxID=1796055 RepID=A0AAV9UHZ9_9PEZI
MPGDLNQEFFLGVLPAGLRFSITQARVYAGPGGYRVSWTGHNDINVTNNDGRCVTVGNSFEPSTGKICVRPTKVSATSSGQPVRLGAMKWASEKIINTNVLTSLFGADEQLPGWVELKFQIAKETGTKRVLASGTITATPSRFTMTGRPDNTDINLKWDGPNGGTEKTRTVAANDIGIDPPAVHLVFMPGKDKKSLGMAFTQQQSLLNTISSYAVQGILYANKKLVEVGVPGGALIVKVIEIPETIDTVHGIVDSANDFMVALKSKNRAAALLAAAKIVQGVVDVGTTVKDIPGDAKGFTGAIKDAFLKKLPQDIVLKDLPKDVLKDVIDRAVDDSLKAEEQKQAIARLRRRQMGQAGRYRDYARA